MAYLLDTNVISEVRKGARANPQVATWFESIPLTEIFLSVLVLGEVRQGIEIKRLRDPQTAQHLDRWLHTLIQRHSSRILPVDLEVADLWGKLCLNQPLPKVDGLIAATALHHGLTLVTRNVVDVERAGVQVLNPFDGTVTG